MKKNYFHSIKPLVLALVLIFGLTCNLSAQQFIHVDLWKNAAGTGGGVTNYPVWIKYGAPLNYTVSGTTDNSGRFVDSLPTVTSNTNVIFITYDCTGNTISQLKVLAPSATWIGDTAIVPCSTPVPVLNVSTSANQSTTNPFEFSFFGGVNDSGLPSTKVYNYQWDFGDGSPMASTQNPTHIYSASGAYIACFTATVTDTFLNVVLFSKTSCVTVQAGTTANCQALFRYQNNPPSASFNFLDSSLVNPPLGGNVSYQWTFGDGSSDTIQNPVHTYSVTGTYTVCLRIDVRDSLNSIVCSDTVCQNVVYSNNPTPVSCNAQYVSFQDSLVANTMQFSSTSSHTGGGAYTTDLSWDFGDGSKGTGNAPSHTYSSSGTYIVCLAYRVLDQAQQLVCLDSICKAVVVVPTSANQFCTASYIVDTANSYFGNVYIWNNSTPTYFSPIHSNSYSWDFGDGDTSNQPFPVHTYANPGIYTVCLTITSADSLNNICTDTFCDTLGVDSLGNLIYKKGTVFTLNVLNPETIGILEREPETFKVYPNPANDKVTLAWTRLQDQDLKWTITDLKGAVLMAGEAKTGGQHEMQVDVSRLKSGVYILSAAHGKNPNTHYKLRIN